MSAEWIKTAKVGDRVVCLDQHQPPLLEIEYPAKGSVWEIRDIVVCPVSFRAGIRLVGYNLPMHPSIGEECIMKPEYFRPVQPRKTDISWAHDILRSAKVGEPA